MRDFKDLKIAVAGTGYVGLSVATLLSQHHKVTAVDIVPEKVELINKKESPIQDEYIEKYLAEKELDLTATLDAKEAYSDADFVVIAAPTNYDSKKNFFDTSAVEAVIKLVIEYNPEAIMVIKSTIPVGWMFFKYFVKAWVAIYLVSNTFTITMAVFDVGQSVVNSASGIINGETAIDVSSLSMQMQAAMATMEIGELVVLALETFLVSFCMKIMSVVISPLIIGRRRFEKRQQG